MTRERREGKGRKEEGRGGRGREGKKYILIKEKGVFICFT